MESLEQKSKLPEVIQMVRDRSGELCVALNHKIISVYVFGHGIKQGGQQEEKKTNLIQHVSVSPWERL